MLSHVRSNWMAVHNSDDGNIITCRTLEGAFCLELGAWGNNFANSHLSPVPFIRRVVRSCLVPQCSYPPHWLCHQRCLGNCDWMPASQTSGQSSYSRCHLTSWALSLRSHIVSSTRSHGPGHLLYSALTRPTSGNARHLNRDKHFFPLHNEPVHLSTTREVGSMGGSPIECRVVGYPYEIPHFHPRHRHLSQWNSSSKNSVGAAQPPPHRCRTFPLLVVQMWFDFLCGLWVWCRRINRRPCCSLISTLSISMELMAWAFWITRQWNDCTTPAPRSCAAWQLTIACLNDEEKEKELILLVK